MSSRVRIRGQYCFTGFSVSFFVLFRVMSSLLVLVQSFKKLSMSYLNINMCWISHYKNVIFTFCRLLLSVACLQRFKKVVKLKNNLFVLESVRDQVTVWNAKMPKRGLVGQELVSSSI